MNQNEKVIRDGMVAVLYSPGYGAGWSTWNRGPHKEVFCPRLVLAVLGESEEDPLIVAKEEFPTHYLGGVEGGLKVRWVKVGDRFEIEEYDGNESVRIFGPDDGMIA